MSMFTGFGAEQLLADAASVFVLANTWLLVLGGVWLAGEVLLTVARIVRRDTGGEDDE